MRDRRFEVERGRLSGLQFVCAIAIEVSIQPVEKTLTDEDFEALVARIVDM